MPHLAPMIWISFPTLIMMIMYLAMIFANYLKPLMFK